MAKIVLGLGTSHAPQLALTPDGWWRRAEGDKRDTEEFWFDGKVYTARWLAPAAPWPSPSGSRHQSTSSCVALTTADDRTRSSHASRMEDQASYVSSYPYRRPRCRGWHPAHGAELGA